MKRHYPEQPLVGVAAVIFKGEEVLLVLRGQEPSKGVWSLPGGLVEVGETLLAAVHREIFEETGLTVKILGVTAVLDRIYRDDAGQIPYHYVLIDFTCEHLGGEPAPGSDATATKFVPLGELEQLDLPEFTAAVIRRAWDQKQSNAFLPLIR
jgi:ADP-ribose pyrophosphatase YjhB (NUDIX family)